MEVTRKRAQNVLTACSTARLFGSENALTSAYAAGSVEPPVRIELTTARLQGMGKRLAWMMEYCDGWLPGSTEPHLADRIHELQSAARRSGNFILARRCLPASRSMRNSCANSCDRATLLIIDAIDAKRHRYVNLAVVAIMVGGVAFDWLRSRRRGTSVRTPAADRG